MNVFETYHARNSLHKFGIQDGSVVYASVRGVHAGFRQVIKSHLTPDDAKKTSKDKTCG